MPPPHEKVAQGVIRISHKVGTLQTSTSVNTFGTVQASQLNVQALKTEAEALYLKKANPTRYIFDRDNPRMPFIPQSLLPQ